MTKASNSSARSFLFEYIACLHTKEVSFAIETKDGTIGKMVFVSKAIECALRDHK